MVEYYEVRGVDIFKEAISGITNCFMISIRKHIVLSGKICLSCNY